LDSNKKKKNPEEGTFSEGKAPEKKVKGALAENLRGIKKGSAKRSTK